MPVLPEVLEVMRALLEKARAKEVNWVSAKDIGIPTVGGAEDFVVSLPDYSVNIWRVGEEMEQPRLFFAILDSHGTQIYFTEVSQGEKGSEELEELLELAKFQALNVDGALNYLKKALEEKGQMIGKPRTQVSSEEEQDLPF